MKLKYANFIKSFGDIKTYLSEDIAGDLCEICIAGRSNVGKSSLINMLAGQHKLAKTSRTPGRTRLINMFDMGGEFILVDLPGYGYAKAPKTEIANLSQLTDKYFSNSTKLKHTLCLVDIRHEPSVLDKHMIKYLYTCGQPFSVILTKADKLSKSQALNMRTKIANSLAIGKDNIIISSANNRNGKEEIFDRIDKVIEAHTMSIVDDEEEFDE